MKTFRIWNDDGKMLAELDDHVLAIIFRAIVTFSTTGEQQELSELSGIEKALYNSMISKMIEDKRRFMERANFTLPKR